MEAKAVRAYLQLFELRFGDQDDPGRPPGDFVGLMRCPF